MRFRNPLSPIRVNKDPRNIYAYEAFYFKDGTWWEAGWAMLDDSKSYVDVIWIKPEFKKLGIGTSIIKFINNDLGYDVKSDIYKNRTKEGKIFVKKLKRNPAATLFVCHGKQHGVPPGILTLDARREADPDIIADITAWNFTKKQSEFKSKFDEIHLIYCPTSVFAKTVSGTISTTSSPVYQTFYNIYFLLKPKGLLIINNFILACLKDSRRVHLEKYNKDSSLPDKVYKIVDNFMKPINKMFVVSQVSVDLDLVLRKVQGVLKET